MSKKSIGKNGIHINQHEVRLRSDQKSTTGKDKDLVCLNFQAPKIKFKMKRIILGIMYCILWYISILVGFFLFICPLLPLVFFHPKLYRKWSEIVFGMWEPFPVALMEIFFGIRTVLTGDHIDPFERSLLIMNHRTRLDWNFLWVGLFHCCHPYSHALKYVLKSAVMHFPGPGWVMQTCSFLFIHRNWAKDQKLLEKLMLYLDISDQPYQILIFPEGTDLTPSNMLKSHKYADEHNLERYYNVLHPKTTGFAFLAHKMKLSGKINAVYDITVGYPGEAPQNESELLKGNFPEQVHFHVKRYSACELPFSEPDLKTWLNNIWKGKEVLLGNFQKTGSFSHFDQNMMEENNSVQNLSPKVRVTSVNNIGNNLTPTSSTTDNILNNMHSKNSLADRNNTFKEEDSFYTALTSTNSIEKRGEGTIEEVHERGVQNSFPNSSRMNDNENVATFSKFTGSSLERDSRCGSESSINRYRPSHLLYLTFLFWVTLIYFTTHQFFVNFYVQMWVLIHALFFSCISFVSDGFHHIIASIYFYRNNINWKANKKNL